jgi:prepilin-type N-terminal cleavage/methylation domain-containing protein
MMNAKRQGFTLVELLVVTLIGSVVLTAVYQTLTIQERSNRQQIAVVTTQQNTRTAIALVASDLREVSAKDNDIVDAGTTHIRYRALRKAGIVCDKDHTGGNNWMDVVLMGQAFANADSVVIFQDNVTTSALDDSWIRAAISSAGSSTGLCPGNPATSIQHLGFPGNTLTLVDTGALVRSYVNVGYRLVNGALYRIEGVDSVPVVEDLDATAGLRLRYFNAAGTQITPSTSALRQEIMRIEIKALGSVIGGQSGSNRVFSDSLIGQVFLRGNQKTS